jgi:hypothetical protein
MDPKTFDRQSQAVYLMLVVVVGLLLGIAGWVAAIF